MNQEELLLRGTKKSTWISMAIASVILTMTLQPHVEAKEVKADDLKACTSITFMTTKKGVIESDSVDEYTRNLSKDEAISKAVARAKVEGSTFSNNKGHCVFTKKK
ncbi:hypothetical protein [Diaphorobacter aerolatus]|uniref:Uncharacterized protein n=1 Tax=Diaphorobacter aerolatus TaxID=1288495 RepID=A0A7H0GJD4_9BURK|nr:hypothetical protein [Diaphorobacter aerolatus]QNP48400.1 hypothetical protein H9K75_20995 [Diaphorobacter aerolatus]